MRNQTLVAGVGLLALLASSADADGPGLGQPIDPAEIAPWDISIGPDGTGLPPGKGTANEGAAIFAENCAGCHGERGIGKPNDALVGGTGTLSGEQPPVKTVGSFWPYATTLFDYVRRAMPLNASKTLGDDQVYALCAYILQQNGIIAEQDVMDARSLPQVRMPNRDGFMPFSRAK